MKPVEIFKSALNREPVTRPPIWLMRQAGRYMPEYQQLRRKHSFMELCHEPELAAEITMQPIQAFGMDAAILFCDILIVAEAIGFQVSVEEGIGPVIHNPFVEEKQLASLKSREEAVGGLDFVAQALQMISKELNAERALLGFVGAPMTVASYIIEGRSSQKLEKTFRLILENRDLFDQLLSRLVDVTAEYVQLQRDNGVDAVQIFESWASLLPERMYLEVVFPHLQRLVELCRSKPGPLIMFAQAPVSLWQHFAKLPVDVLSVGHNIDMAKLRETYPEKAVQGNLDPRYLLVDEEIMLKECDRILDQMQECGGHIFNLGHGVTPNVPTERVKALVDRVMSRG